MLMINLITECHNNSNDGPGRYTYRCKGPSVLIDNDY